VALGVETVEETRAFNARLARLHEELPPIESVPAAATRAARRRGEGILPAPVLLDRAHWLEIPSRSGGLRLRVVAPAGEPRGAYLHLHGGGWVLGGADEQDPLLAAIADTAGLCAVSVDYRLAPEHPYPAGPDDCEEAALWLVERGAEELGVPARFAIGGESAGANLSVVSLLRLRDRHSISGVFTAANLVYGGFDLGGSPSRRAWGERKLVLTDAGMRWFNECYLPGLDAEESRAPDISPLYAALHDLPPALFTVGTADPLLDDTLLMAERWQAAGNRAELRVYEEACHAFTAFPLAVARLANEAQLAFLRDAAL
jgi:acetyl esterase/lipase